MVGHVDLATYRGRVAQTVQGHMDANHIGQKVLSERTGIPPRTLHRKLSAEVSFSSPQLFAISKALGTTLSAILKEAE